MIAAARSSIAVPAFNDAGARARADQVHDLARAMIRQARMLRASGSETAARELAGRARALDLLGWSYVTP